MTRGGEEEGEGGRSRRSPPARATVALPSPVVGERERRGERLREREREEGERIFLKVAAIYTAGCRGGW